MQHATSFREILRRVRAGDQNAATDLVREFEPKVRSAVRTPLDDHRLRAFLDSGDISQTVFTNFFVRAEMGQFELETPDHLLGLLVTMARNNVLDEARKNRAGCRDRRRLVSDPEHCLSGMFDTGPTPSRAVADRDLAEHVYSRLDDGERYLLEQRTAGREWSQLAEELDATPGALRKQLTRAIQRVSRELFPAFTA